MARKPGIQRACELAAAPRAKTLLAVTEVYFQGSRPSLPKETRETGVANHGGLIASLPLPVGGCAELESIEMLLPVSRVPCCPVWV